MLPTGMGLSVHGHDRHDEEHWEANDRREISHDGIEVAEHLDGGKLTHPHEGLDLEEDLEATGAPAGALLENLS